MYIARALGQNEILKRVKNLKKFLTSSWFHNLPKISRRLIIILRLSV